MTPLKVLLVLAMLVTVAESPAGFAAGFSQMESHGGLLTRFFRRMLISMARKEERKRTRGLPTNAFSHTRGVPAQATAGDRLASLIDNVANAIEESNNKVTIVGTGKVGTAVAFSLMTQYVTDEIVLIGRHADEVNGEVEDLQHGSGFIKSPKITGSTDYKASKNSKVCIVTAGAKQMPGQSRLSLVQTNLKIFRTIIPQLIQYSPNAVILVVTNPVDIMTYITWKLADKKNTYKIIGSGTNLDSSRLRFLISQNLNISSDSVNGWVIGEHGDSSVTAWSGVEVAGVNLHSLDNEDDDWFASTHKKVQRSAYDIIDLKGYTSWAVGLSVTNLVYSILHNVHSIHAVSTMVKGLHGIEEEVFISLPLVLGENGVTHIVQQPLREEELIELQESVVTLVNKIKQLDWS